ncbi:hypothetical protein SASPL_115432 [Salvia splendens]|uniref:DNA polymerase phi n=1 Tax=Salvia splendens TaxID=180675 RepID=A0A8X9A312_SALSN|nr:hypothetical protein SASPL_115432 [Salvia splendens]
MGSISKKRESQESAFENGEDKQKLNAADVEPSRKKMKKEKKKKDIELLEAENVNGADAAPASSNAHKTPLNSMERRKHRKLQDKVRHGGDKRISDSRPVKMDVELKNEIGGTTSSGSGSGVLPEFHIGVFKELSAADASVREAAAKTLVVELREVQNAYDTLENKDEVEDKSKLEVEKDDGLNNCAPSVRYAVRRLIRGVSSSRECARQGFALGLTMLIATVHSINLESLLKLITTLLEVSSSMKGQEVKDCLLGRLFAYGALARSGKFTEEWTADNNSELIKEFTKCLIDLAVKKRYLQEPAVAILLEIVGKLPEEALLKHLLEAPGLQEWFEGATETGNPDALSLALKIQEKLPEGIYLLSARVHSVWPVLVSYHLPDVVNLQKNLQIRFKLLTLENTEFLKSWVVESLPAVQKHLKLDQDAAKFRVQKEVLKFLAVQGLFSSSLGTEVTSFELQEKFRWPKSAIPSALTHTCIEQLQLLLANAQKGEGPQAVASGVEAKDLGSYFMRFLGILYNIPSVSLSRALNSDDEEAFKKLQAMESQLSKEERNCAITTDASKLHALRYLLIQLLLQIILRPGEFSEAASEIVMCCKKAFISSDLESSGEDEVVKKDLKPARHHNTDSEDDDAEDDLLGLEEAEESDEAETGETVDSDQQTDESESVVGVDVVTAELPDALDDESDEGMDDDAMFRMDRRTKQEEKLHILSLSSLSSVSSRCWRFTCMKIQASKPQVIKIFSNLAQAFTNPHTTEGSAQLGQRIWGIIQKKIFKAKEYPKGETVSVAVLKPLLEKYLKLAAKAFKRKKSASNPSKKKQFASLSRHKMINSLARSSTFWILKIIDASNFSESELQRVCDTLQNILVDYFDSKKSQMKCEFLKEIFRRRPWIGKQLFGFLLEKCSCAKSQFRQVEALDLVTEVLKAHGSVSGKASKKFLKSHISKISHLIKHLVTNMPEKQARRAAVRRFCGKVFQMLTTF